MDFNDFPRSEKYFENELNSYEVENEKLFEYNMELKKLIHQFLDKYEWIIFEKILELYENDNDLKIFLNYKFDYKSMETQKIIRFLRRNGCNIDKKYHLKYEFIINGLKKSRKFHYENKNKIPGYKLINNVSLFNKTQIIFLFENNLNKTLMEEIYKMRNKNYHERIMINHKIPSIKNIKIDDEISMQYLKFYQEFTNLKILYEIKE